jgi:ribosomal protein S18 acetylase RimI-like enzyme
VDKKEISFFFCDYSNHYHQEKFVWLINHYITDPMGGNESQALTDQSLLIEGMANHPSGFVLFVAVNGKIAGLVTCFINFSTFKAKKYLNIHDIIIQKEYRSAGIGRKLMEKCIDIANERELCKVTLEVREDNLNAKTLYESLGFKETDPKMLFWTRVLS